VLIVFEILCSNWVCKSVRLASSWEKVPLSSVVASVPWIGVNSSGEAVSLAASQPDGFFRPVIVSIVTR
jgi:hypothetical protein